MTNSSPSPWNVFWTALTTGVLIGIIVSGVFVGVTGVCQ